MIDTLPPYIVLDESQPQTLEMLKTPAESYTFPLSKNDLEGINQLQTKYRQEENCSGLAGPQIGLKKRAIIFALEENPNLKKWRPDLTDTMPETIWLNPEYFPRGEEQQTDYEACFSVKDVAGPVARFKKIGYAAYTLEGKKIEGEAQGFLARIIQHEVDHLNGVCFTDHVAPGHLISIEAYRQKRKAAMESQK